MLTPRELQIAELISLEYLNKEIADKLGISIETVKNHIRHIQEKLNVKSKVGIAVWWVERQK